MSAHVISEPPRTPHTIIIGWDGPTQTFFLQVINGNEDEEDTLIDLGNRPGALPTIADLEAILSDSPLTSGITLTPELRRTLEQDKAASPQPTALQRRIAEILLPSSKQGA